LPTEGAKPELKVTTPKYPLFSLIAKLVLAKIALSTEGWFSGGKQRRPDQAPFQQRDGTQITD